MTNLSENTGQKQSADFWVVTSCTPEYIPGLEALRNSLEMFFPECKLACFYYDRGTSKALPDRIHYIHNAPLLGPAVNIGKSYVGRLTLGPDMYSRLLIPKYFEGRVFYVDADCVVIDTLKEAWDMDLQGFPTACVLREDIGWEGGSFEDKMASGTFLCDTESWENRKLVEEMFQVMKDYEDKKIKRRFNVNVESTMGYVHNNDFLPLNRKYQNLAYYGCLSKEDKIIHWGGPKPWAIKGHPHNRANTNYADLWDAFYNNDKALVDSLISKLPDKLSDKIDPKDRMKVRKNNVGVKIL